MEEIENLKERERREWGRGRLEGPERVLHQWCRWLCGPGRLCLHWGQCPAPDSANLTIVWLQSIHWLFATRSARWPQPPPPAANNHLDPFKSLYLSRILTNYLLLLKESLSLTFLLIWENSHPNYKIHGVKNSKDKKSRKIAEVERSALL